MKPLMSMMVATGSLLPSFASAALLSRDSFSAYVPGQELPLQNPTIAGYAGAWTDVAFGNAEPAVESGNLVYAGANYVAGGGDKVGKAADGAGIGAGNSGRVERLLDTALVASDATNGTLYLAWLFQTGNEGVAANPNVYQTLALWNGTGGNDGLRDFEAGIAAGDFATPNYGFRVDNNAPANLNIAPDANVHLFVAKFVLSSTDLSDSVTVWIDPVLGAGEPAGGVTISGKNLAWDRLALSDYASNSSHWDEIRWGTTFNSVTTESFLPATPSFTLQPGDINGLVGDPIILAGTAESDPAPGYQWQKSSDGTTGWTNVDGATSSSLQFASAVYADRGYYRLVATNANGSATSNVGQLVMAYPDPGILTQPASASAEEGTDVTIFVTASGLGNLTYQWFKDGEPVSGATSDALQLNDVDEDDQGAYWVRVTDEAAISDGQPATTVDSAVANVDVFAVPSGLISHDPFNTAAGYVIGEIPDQNPTVAGYTGAWVDVDFGDAEPAISAGSLTYSNPNYLGSTGDKASVPNNTTNGEINPANSGRTYRLLEGPLQATSGTAGVRYLSFLFQSGQETGATVYQALHLNQGNGDGNRQFDLGLTNNGGQTGLEYSFGLGGNYTSTGVAANANVRLFVVKFDFSADPFEDNVTVWVDPVLGAGDPAGGTTVNDVNLTWDRLCLSDYDGNSAAWDEVRWGTTFDSVTLNPNPPANFAAWIAGYPEVGGLTGFNDDADGDGLENGVENFLGTNPAVGNAGLTQVAKNGSTVTFRHSQNATPASDVTAAYRWSTDLQNFHNSGETSGGATVTFSPSTNTPTAGTTSVSATISGSVPTKIFFAIEATQATP
jgi:hypothetical protein